MSQRGWSNEVGAPSRSRIRPAWRAAGAVAFASLAILGGCGGSDPEITPVGEITADPRRHYGDEVVVETTVSRQIDHRVWEMAHGRLFAIRDEPLHPLPTTGERLRLRGTIRPLEKQTIEAELGINIEHHFYTDPFLADDFAFVVASVERLDETNG